jgi:Ricin-type beta-trefoil lectin domain
MSDSFRIGHSRDLPEGEMMFSKGKIRMLRPGIAGAVLAISAMSGLMASPGIAHAATWGTMKNGYGLCLDDTNYSTTGGTQMQVYTCNGLATQNWHIYQSEERDPGVYEYMFQVQQSGMCLDEYQQTGSKVIQWSCNSKDPAQWWVGTENANGGFQYGSDYYLDAGNAAGDKVTAANVEPVPNSAPTDSWTMPPS